MGKLPISVTSKDKSLLDSTTVDIRANVVVIQDGTDNFSFVAQAVASTSNNSEITFIIYVKMGKYMENIQTIGEKKNLMLMGDGTNAIVTTGSLTDADVFDISQSATIGIFLVRTQKHSQLREKRD